MLMFNPLLLARGFCEVGANFSFTIAILHVPIADVTAIIQTCPLLVLAGAKLFYGESLGLSRLLLIALGITGALLVAQPGAPTASPYVLLGFVTALSAAARDLITRKVPGHIPAPIVAFAVLVFLMLAGEGAMLAFETPVLPNAWQLALIVLAAALMVAGHVLIFLAYRFAGARTIAPFMYTLTLWAVLSGVVLFGDRPNILAVAGMALILLAGLIVVYADGRRRNGPVRTS
jgi:drug/metabolite transporter (DMT)-like permease